ncbi:HAD hydrolase-like protein [Labrenzia sp. CE80]|uniref:HAD-IIA family hydrolase n=1 Tax=Labrenzia sp. CE80 TaxID=1788986 RepID=UPI00129AD5E5|nr:HAD hydrolase-like protein [Labrenzia sp. CE80]
MTLHQICSGLEVDKVDGYSAILCDLDGCLIAGGAALPGAREFTAAVGDRLWIVSNNSSDTARSLSIRLADLGISVSEDRILLAGEQAVVHLNKVSPKVGLRCLTDAPVRQKAELLGFNLSPKQAEYVLLGRMASFNLYCLEQAIADLKEGARLLVANIDKTHPDQDGNPVPETGAWLAALEACLPELIYECFGKPSTYLLSAAIQRSGTLPESGVFVGDNPETDGEAARLMGMDFTEIRRTSAPPFTVASGNKPPAVRTI